MIITYLLLLITAVLCKYLDIPGAGLIFIFSVLFPIIDFLVQIIRKREDKTGNILSTSIVMVLSLFFMFKFLTWPGAITYLFMAVVVGVFYFVRIYKEKTKKNIRFYIVSFLFLFAIFNATLSGSTFISFYLKNDALNESLYTSHFNRTKLAFAYYNEGQFDKAETLVTFNIRHLTSLVQEDSVNRDLEQSWSIIDSKNLEQSQKDLLDIKNKTWNDIQVYTSEDRPDIRLKSN